MLSTNFKEFVKNLTSGGQILLFTAGIAILLSSLNYGTRLEEFWNQGIGGFSKLEWINDGFMSLFFLLVGLEIKREITHGELSKPRASWLPLSAAAGGMLVPAIIYIFLNWNTKFTSGFGIPTATDIAFSLTIVKILGKSVSTNVKIFLTALALFDDLGAVLLITFCYGKTLNIKWLLLAVLLIFILRKINYSKSNTSLLFWIIALVIWLSVYNSGIHPTLAGIILAFALPNNEASNTFQLRIEKKLNFPVSNLILPLFILSNLIFSPTIFSWQSFNNSLVWGIFLGLVIGKPMGIYLGTKIIGVIIPNLLTGISTKEIIGVGILSGIGFTMSIFISNLAFSESVYLTQAKLGIILSSGVSSILGISYFMTQSNVIKK